MSDRWYYRIYGQEFGPVSLELVRTLVASGTIAPDDEVRDANRSNWILACAATELRGSNKTPAIGLAVERRSVRDEWFCRGATGDFGPLTLSDLIQLAAIGDLKPNQDVKSRDDEYWRQLRSIRRLCELLPFPDPERTRPRGAHLSIFVDDATCVEATEAAAVIASACNHQDPSELVSCLLMPTAQDGILDAISSRDLEGDDDCEHQILPFPNAAFAKTDGTPTCSNPTLNNPGSESQSAERTAPSLPLESGDVPQITGLLKRISSEISNRLERHRHSFGISIMISIGLIVLAWITKRDKL